MNQFKNSELLDAKEVQPDLKDIFIYLGFELGSKFDLVLTSVYRRGDTKLHGKGLAVDFQLVGQWLHIFQYCNLIHDTLSRWCKTKQHGYEFRIYEGMQNGKYKQHIHFGLHLDKPGHIAVVLGFIREALRW